jgi:hypothetical protein
MGLQVPEQMVGAILLDQLQRFVNERTPAHKTRDKHFRRYRITDEHGSVINENLERYQATEIAHKLEKILGGKYIIEETFHSFRGYDTFTEGNPESFSHKSSHELDAERFNAPVPVPSRSCAARTKIAKRRIRDKRIVETSVMNIPKEYLDTHGGVAILDADTLHVRYCGTKETAFEYINQLYAQGIKPHQIRAIDYKLVAAYINMVKKSGIQVYVHGMCIFAGTAAEAAKYIEQGIKAKRFGKKEFTVRNYREQK